MTGNDSEVANGLQSKELPKISQMGSSKSSKEEPPEDVPTSLFILGKDNIIRTGSQAIIRSTAFEYTILGTIIVNCVVMAMVGYRIELETHITLDDVDFSQEEHLPNRDKSVFTQSLDKTENYFLAIFSTETFLKIIAQGFILHPGSYMRSIWNTMDFLVVSTGCVVSLLVTDIETILFQNHNGFACGSG